IGIDGIDIDAIANDYKNINQINFFDIGAFIFAGPIGTAITKGFDLGKLGVNAMKDSKTLISKVEVNVLLQKGIVTMQDVALATAKNRIAAVGAINLNNQKFEDFKIALLDSKNCAKYYQEIGGTLTSPVIQLTQTTFQTAVNLATSLFGKVVKGARDIVDLPDSCKPFYSGSVLHPN
ncbi:MAG: hypothetical protein K2I63_02880, partial [Helicobacter sp.]|nr:hypothetical protein [Helicobacter sp.]